MAKRVIIIFVPDKEAIAYVKDKKKIIHVKCYDNKTCEKIVIVNANRRMLKRMINKMVKKHGYAFETFAEKIKY